MPPERPLLTLSQAAVLLGQSRAWAYSHRDEVPGVVQIGGRYWVRSAVLERWLAGESEPAPAPLRRVG